MWLVGIKVCVCVCVCCVVLCVERDLKRGVIRHSHGFEEYPHVLCTLVRVWLLELVFKFMISLTEVRHCNAEYCQQPSCHLHLQPVQQFEKGWFQISARSATSPCLF